MASDRGDIHILIQTEGIYIYYCLSPLHQTTITDRHRADDGHGDRRARSELGAADRAQSGGAQPGSAADRATHGVLRSVTSTVRKFPVLSTAVQ